MLVNNELNDSIGIGSIVRRGLIALEKARQFNKHYEIEKTDMGNGKVYLTIRDPDAPTPHAHTQRQQNRTVNRTKKLLHYIF